VEQKLRFGGSRLGFLIIQPNLGAKMEILAYAASILDTCRLS
jgi:hypothetical protein